MKRKGICLGQIYEGLIYENGIVTMTNGPTDVHGHPRALDPITDFAFVEADGYEGKAGLPAYTEIALSSGITVVSAMPNEFYRRLKEGSLTETELIQRPISNLARAEFMEYLISTQSRILMPYHLGLDPEEIIFGDQELLDARRLRQNFLEAGKNASALKGFVNESTGGNNVPVRHIGVIGSIWHEIYPTKPLILHAEGQNVETALALINEQPHGKDLPVHIAHVSSRQELTAVIKAKLSGMKVTCEVTPHHLFATEDEGTQIGGYGQMLPSLKRAEDLRFLWEHIDWIDVIASDCAPHKPSEKEAASPAKGVTNHTTMMALLFGAMDEGRLSLEQIYEKTVLNPRRIFNLPDDNTVAKFNLKRGYETAEDIERLVFPRYGQNIFVKLEEILGKEFHLLGHLVYAQSGSSSVHGLVDEHNRVRRKKLRTEYKTDLRHLVKIAA